MEDMNPSPLSFQLRALEIAEQLKTQGCTATLLAKMIQLNEQEIAYYQHQGRKHCVEQAMLLELIYIAKALYMDGQRPEDILRWTHIDLETLQRLKDM
ncbi:MAG: hypothetical protein AAFQ08_01290 [Bacteroidota bacterium]